MASIQVAVRCRPFHRKDKLGVKFTQVSDEVGRVELINSDIPYKKNAFSVNYAWWSASNFKRFLEGQDEVQARAMTFVDQQRIYEQLGTKAYKDFMSGELVLLLSYGMEKSGKTFSLYGIEAADESLSGHRYAWYRQNEPHVHWGIFPRFLHNLFMEKQDSWIITIKHFQNIADSIRDLLSPTAREEPSKYGIRRGANGYTDIDWLTSKTVNSMKELCEEYTKAHARKCFAPTQYNPFSLRGHCIMILDVHIPSQGDQVSKPRRLYVCNLVGCVEAAGQLQYAKYNRRFNADGSIEHEYVGIDPDTKKSRELQDQAKKINLSLSEMGQLLKKTAEVLKKGKPVTGSSVPGCNTFFPCKFLKDCMLNGKTYLICTILPGAALSSDSVLTLGFAANAAVVKMTKVDDGDNMNAQSNTKEGRVEKEGVDGKGDKNEDTPASEGKMETPIEREASSVVQDKPAVQGEVSDVDVEASSVVQDKPAVQGEGPDADMEASSVVQDKLPVQGEVADVDIKAEMSQALLRGKKPWRRSKIMIVGEGRAGKTALSNSIIGRDFSDTKSTIGISNLTCDIKYAALNGDSWQEYSKPAKELEVALARMMVDRRLHRGQDTAAIDGKELEEYNEEIQGGYQEDVEETQQTSLNEPNVTTDYDTSFQVIASPGIMDVAEADAPSFVALKSETMQQESSPTSGLFTEQPSIIKADVPAKTDVTIDQGQLSDASPSIDEDLVMKCLADRIHTESKFIISLFDFGGQSVFNVIHHFFLTKYGVYFLVFNMEWLISGNEVEKDSCLAYLSFWLNSVVIHTQNSLGQVAPIAFVGTRKDRVCSPSQHEAISTILYNEFCGSLAGPYIVENEHAEGRNGATDLYFFPVDNTLGRRDPTLQKLLRVVEEILDSSSYVHAEQPLAWLQALDMINSRSMAHVSYDNVVSICGQCGLSANLVPTFLRFAHEMGVLMWHDDDELRDVVIMNPIEYFIQPATVVICKHSPGSDDSIYHSLDIHRKVKKKRNADWNEMLRRGVISEALLLDLLAPSDPHQQHILQLMLKYGLLVELTEGFQDGVHDDEQAKQPGAQSERRAYLAPALLPLFHKQTVDTLCSTFVPEPVAWACNDSTFYFLFAVSKDLERSAIITWDDSRQFGFLPSGLFERLIGRTISWSQVTTALSMPGVMQVSSLFKDEAVLSFGSQRFRMSLLSRQNMIRIEVEGHNPLGIHARLVNLVERVISECMKSLNFFTVLELRSAECEDTSLKPSHPIDYTKKFFVRLKQVRGAAKRHSALNLVGSGGRKLISALEVEKFYRVWLTEFQVFDSYDVFFSYRWGKEDSMFTQTMFDILTLHTVGSDHRSIRVFLDSRRLREGRNFQQEFVSGLVHSSVICPVVTPEALRRLENHDDQSEDNLLVEWILSISCFNHVDSEESLARRKIRLPQPRIVLPIVFGSRSGSQGVIGDFFQEDWLSRLTAMVPTASLMAAERLLSEHAISLSPDLRSMTVRDIVRRMLTFLCITTWTIPANGPPLVSSIAERLVSQVQQVLQASSVHASPSLVSNEKPAQQDQQQHVGGNDSETAVSGAVGLKALDSLSMEEVGRLLTSLGMQVYIPVFLERSIDGASLACCESADDLKEAGIDIVMQARKLFKKIAGWKVSGVSEGELK